LKTSNLFIKAILIKLTALSLILALFGNLAAQTFHQHTETKRSYKSNSSTKLNIAEHCKVCDHFHHHNSAGIAPDVVFPAIANRPAATQSSWFYQQSIFTYSIDGHINKGPPVL
jgi:hypothetical protein